MTAFSSLDAVSVALALALNVSAITAIAPGGAADDVPQAPTFPFLLFEVSERFDGQIGTKPGDGAQYEVDLTLHAYAQANTTDGAAKQAQQLINAAIGLLADAPAVAGFSSWAIFHDTTSPANDELVAGIKVKEVVSRHRLFVELAA